MGTAVFPTLPGLGWSITRTQIFKARKQVSVSGKETALADWAYPRWQWELVFDLLRQGGGWTEMQQLAGFYAARNGGFDSFLYQDQDDNAVSSQQIAVGDGVATQFQLVRSFGGFTEPVLAPNQVTSVTVGGTPKVNGTDYGIGTWGNGVTPPGTITFFTGAPAAGAPIAASFSYYWPCRFVDDQCAFEKFMAGAYQVRKLTFMSIK